PARWAQRKGGLMGMTGWRALAPIMCAAFLLAASLGATGCSRQSLKKQREGRQRIELPGFSIELPLGKVVATSKVPSQGKHQVALSASQLEHWLDDWAINGSVSVHWSSQAPTRDEWMNEELPMILKASEGSIPNGKLLKEETIDPERWLIVAGTSRLPLAMGVVRCDPAFAIEVTYIGYH